ncbi:PIG-L deacetylase family protein [Streptomonospora algeriensis]|uniref:PIG-L deacetylase family protein n=1 Tax=Streptomonospora algeriensis TaxID=995084 RepID=A0ABW3BFU2_9ACTN
MFDWSKQRLLVIAPHPDDEVLGCGGLLHKAKTAGAEVYVQFLTVGDTADVSDRGFSTASERVGEIKAVADHYRWDDWQIAFPGDDYHLRLDAVPRFEIANTVERHSPLSIASVEPTVVIAPHQLSYNQDHQAAAEAVHTALRPSDTRRRHHPELVLAYEEAADQWRQEPAGTPNLLVELGQADFDAKITAMRLYGSQCHDHPHTRSELTLQSLAVLRGMQGGVASAEGYYAMRWLA